MYEGHEGSKGMSCDKVTVSHIDNLMQKQSGNEKVNEKVNEKEKDDLKQNGKQVPNNKISKDRKRLNKKKGSEETSSGEERTENAANATDILKTSLLRFFENKENIDRFLPIINRTSPVSLRLLDYFCVNYSRSTQVVYMIMDKYFDVHSSYKNQLKTFSKKRFDPFRRNSRLTFRYENERFDTTIGQLCFFKWCLTHKVLDYVEKNIAAISEDMKKNTGKSDDDMSRVPSEKKRRTTSRKSSTQMAATRVPTPPGTDTIIVCFD